MCVKSLGLNQITQEFQQNGYVVLPNFLSETKMQILNDAIERHYQPYAEGAEQWLESGGAADKFACDVVGWDPCSEGSTPFLALRDDASLQQVTTACLGEGFTTSSSLVMWAAPYGRGQSWHQDCPVDNSREYNFNRLFYTRDVLLEDGAVVVVPASHRRGTIPAGGHQEPITGERVITPAAGTLILLHGHIYHRVTPNTSGKPRTSINFRAFPEGVSPELCEVGVYRSGAINFRTGELLGQHHADEN